MNRDRATGSYDFSVQEEEESTSDPARNVKPITTYRATGLNSPDYRWLTLVPLTDRLPPINRSQRCTPTRT